MGKSGAFSLPFWRHVRTGGQLSQLRPSSWQRADVILKQQRQASTNSPLRRQNRLPAAYYRGGTSRAIFFRREDLPQDKKQWESIFLGCIGSPDPYGRQLDGMGGGISSLSKVCVVGPSTRPDADVDYTFVALGVRDAEVDYSSNCGNMSTAVGPFAVDSGMLDNVPSSGVHESITVRIHNTNTGKLIHASFPVVDGEAAASGEFAMDGVAGTAARVRLDFVEPGGSRTGNLLPTGNVIDEVSAYRQRSWMRETHAASSAAPI